MSQIVLPATSRSDRWRRPLALALFLAASACETVAPIPPEELDLWSDAAAGVADGELASLCASYWELTLEADPIGATYLGDPRWHGELPPIDPRALDALSERLGSLRRRAAALEEDGLDADDRLTRGMLLEELENRLARLELDLESWQVDPLEGPHIALLNLAQVQPVATARERDQVLERWRAVPGHVRQVVRNLRRGLAAGRTAPRTAVQKQIEQLDELLAASPLESPLVRVADGGGEWIELRPGDNLAALAHERRGDARRSRELGLTNPHALEPARAARGTRVLLPSADDPLAPEERGRFLSATIHAVEDGIWPAWAEYRAFLRDELLPRARSDETCGLVHLPGGARTYRLLVHQQTSLPPAECDPEAIHRFGLEEVARIRAEIASLGATVLGTSDVAEVQRRLRSDPAMHFQTREEVRAKAEEALARANRAAPRFFGLLPRTRCRVVPVPAFEEKDTTIAYYRQPSADGERPGQYFVNTYAPETRPRYEAEVLAYHEAVPGHHLQIAIAQELEDLPRFRRHGGSTAFVEGWALYTERLSDEMGLYGSDLDRLGILSFDAWRACRLVVDTGIHALGWSRERAIDYVFENTLLARNNVENEVDRYIAWPAQALAYKIGQREILALRERARAALGSSFSLSAFHDRVLENGAVTLPALRTVVDAWIATER